MQKHVYRNFFVAVLVAFALPALLLLVLAFLLSPPSPTRDSAVQQSNVAATNSFAGSESCAKCHPQQYELWKNSTHGRAGGPPEKSRVIARFDGTPLHFKDAVVTPLINANGEYIFAVEPEGAPKMEIKVDAVVGGGHMYGGGTQSFFEKFPDGTVRFLPFDFIRREGLWFVQLRRDKSWAPISREISLQTDLANWPPHRVLGTLTEFSNCQNCHGSQIAVAYNPQAHKYDTHFQSLAINCESCHGPGKRHIEIVSRPGWEKLPEIGMKPLATLSKEQSLLVCFQCHASKDTIREAAYLPGMQLEDFFSLKLPVFEDSFTVDGRVRGFGYQSTHLYSDCYLDGSMTCVDCHDPHSQSYRDVFGKPLQSRFDNGQCTSCHASKAVNTTAHSHHKADSPGNLCVGCHMPYLQHQTVGTALMFARSDHSIPIPRPAFDQRLGLENACQKCHRDKDLSWQESKIKEWYGEIKPHHPMISNLIKALAVTNQTAAAKLLLDPAAKHPMAQMTGLLKFTVAWLRPNMDSVDPDVVTKLKSFAQSDDLDLQSMALLALHFAYDRDTNVHALLRDRLNTFKDENDPVRNLWAVAMDYLGSAYASEDNVTNAIITFRKSLEVRPDNVVAISHLAMALFQAGDSAEAISTFQSAVKARPEKAVLHFQLAQLYARLQRLSDAINELEEGLKYAPEDPNAKHMLQQLRNAQ